MEKSLPKIYTISDPTEEKFLRTKTAPFDFSSKTPKEINKLVQTMRRVMKASVGIGLSANQIGLNFQLFVAEITRDENHNSKLYAIFNPKITEKSKETVPLAEGCLSVPGVYGEVERHREIILKGQDKNQKEIIIHASGLPAHIFQHEVDHLNGILFIDKAKNIYKNETNATNL